jgi:hypothetical protein
MLNMPGDPAQTISGSRRKSVSANCEEAPMSHTVENTATKQHETHMMPEPQKAHRWLNRLVGEWTYESNMMAEPGQTAERMTGTESVRSLGGLWIVGEGTGEMPGGGLGTTLIELGFDPAKNRFVGTWIGSMMTNLWVYDGELDSAERVLTLNSEGPSMAGDGTMTHYQDVIELKSDDYRVLTARVLGPDGKWQELMTMEYRRKK